MAAKVGIPSWNIFMRKMMPTSMNAQAATTYERFLSMLPMAKRKIPAAVAIPAHWVNATFR